MCHMGIIFTWPVTEEEIRLRDAKWPYQGHTASRQWWGWDSHPDPITPKPTPFPPPGCPGKVEGEERKWRRSPPSQLKYLVPGPSPISTSLWRMILTRRRRTLKHGFSPHICGPYTDPLDKRMAQEEMAIKIHLPLSRVARFCKKKKSQDTS